MRIRCRRACSTSQAERFVGVVQAGLTTGWMDPRRVALDALLQIGDQRLACEHSRCSACHVWQAHRSESCRSSFPYRSLHCFRPRWRWPMSSAIRG